MTQNRRQTGSSTRGSFSSQWAKMPVQEKDRLAHLFVDGGALDQEAAALGLQKTTLERYIRMYITCRVDFQHESARAIQLPASFAVPYTNYTILHGDNYIIISDVEIPDHSPEMILLVMLVAIKHGIKHLIIAGDYVATDQPSLNSWGERWRAAEDLPYQTTVDMSIGIIKEFFRIFDTIDIIEGNHDDRVARATGGEVFLGMLLNGTGARYSRYEYLYLRTSRGLVKVCHPDSFSDNSVKLGQEIFNVEWGPDPVRPEKCHIVLGHTHRQMSGFSHDNSHEIYGLGCLRDPWRTKYARKRSSKHKLWNLGFLMIKDGYFYPYSWMATNWEAELGSLCPDWARPKQRPGVPLGDQYAVGAAVGR